MVWLTVILLFFHTELWLEWIFHFITLWKLQNFAATILSRKISSNQHFTKEINLTKNKLRYRLSCFTRPWHSISAFLQNRFFSKNWMTWFHGIFWIIAFPHDIISYVKIMKYLLGRSRRSKYAVLSVVLFRNFTYVFLLLSSKKVDFGRKST